MHRNSLLSWIMDKSAPELDLAFYLRVGSFGTAPLIAGWRRNIRALEAC
jgi:hypothetical protein